jgi:hypothetical protein
MQFSKQHNLSPPNMYSVAKGKEQTHRGWKCFYKTKEIKND